MLGRSGVQVTKAHPMRAARNVAVAAAHPLALKRWVHGGALALLFTGVAVAAIPPAGTAATAQDHQWQALALAPLSSGGRTGLRLDASDAVQPIEVAPERAQLDLTMTLAAGEALGSLLVRAGTPLADAAAADSMIRSGTQRLAPGTAVSVSLGARSPAGTRPLQRLALRAGLGLTLQVIRGSDGQLQLVTQQMKVDATPLRVRGRAGDGLYWALRAAGVSPQSAAEYLQALATQIDVGSEVTPDDRFDLVIARRGAATGDQQAGPLLYAGLDRSGSRDLQLVKWAARGRSEWIDPLGLDQPGSTAMEWPAAGRITSGFGYRVHPILRFARMHRGVDFGASWGSPIVAAADGQVAMAGWAGGYGRQVRIAHAGGLLTSYSHMSSIVAEPGSYVRRGQLIGYVGSSGLSTGPHLHYEVYRNGTAVNPLSVRFAGGVVDRAQANAVRARLKALLSVGTKRS
jgi:murein DD-endopeptidase MepM/ murein hydrolase activator NlpD